MNENEIGAIVADEAIHLHKALGPGLLETVYEVVLARRLATRGLKVQRQVAVPIEFEGEQFEEGFRADLIVEGKVLLELKCVEKVSGDCTPATTSISMSAFPASPLPSSSSLGSRTTSGTKDRKMDKIKMSASSTPDLPLGFKIAGSYAKAALSSCSTRAAGLA